MKLRKGNNQLSDLAKNFINNNNDASQIDISFIVIKPWLQQLIRPRTQSEQSNLQADIEINGLTTPITLATIDGEDFCLVDGHGRLESYKQLQKNTIPFVVKSFKNKDEIRNWVFRKQLGRRNLSKQDRAYLIGSLQDSKAKISRELEIGTTQIADARKYYRAVNWLIQNQDKNKDDLLKSSISNVIALYNKLSRSTRNKETIQAKKSVNWKLDQDLVSRLKEFAQINDAKSISQQVEHILQEYLDNHAQ